MANFKELLSDFLKNYLKERFPEVDKYFDVINLESPSAKELGDIAFPCFGLAKLFKKNPSQISTDIAASLTATKQEATDQFPEFISKINHNGGYVNFFIKPEVLASSVITSTLSGTLTNPAERNGERVMVEYSQPNTHKAFHVGHCRCASLGDSIARILEWNGSEVIPVNYIGDEGTHVAKCLWLFEKKYNNSLPKDAAERRGEFLGQVYSEANNLLDLEAQTAVPLPGVISAEILATQEHPKKKNWLVIKLTTGRSGEKTVVSGLTGFKIGDIIAYAPTGTEIGRKKIEALDKDGVTSEGMILSLKESTLGEDNDKPVILPKGTAVGEELVEIYRFNRSDPRKLLDIISEREQEVRKKLATLESEEPQAKKIWLETRQWCLDEFEEIYRWLNCRFERVFTESEVRDLSKEIVLNHYKKGSLILSDGAIGIDLSTHGLGFFMLLKRDGTALYSTRDLGLAEIKFKDYNIDRSLYVVDAAQSLHFKQLFKTLEILGFPQAKNCHHIDYAQVVRPEGKMSSRKGNIILFNELKNRLMKKFADEHLAKYVGVWSENEIRETTRRLALATIRYGMLNQLNNTQIVFDLDEWSQVSGNTGPYILYVGARINSILRETSEENILGANFTLLTDSSEQELIKQLAKFRESVAQAVSEYSAQPICVYLYELCKRFNSMYAKVSILKAESKQLKLARVGLIKAVRVAIVDGLKLLGIESVERM
ncbi:MAG TPA: arginine--tRNA ligase [Oligoflexia bacterium]|nr:arginine--tRNA ligase [Oligoflexia bacterium]HMP26796.1 arginine--tRNA ligase [Oligoflexia bacterium]